jgi:hypothetical protein
MFAGYVQGVETNGAGERLMPRLVRGIYHWNRMTIHRNNPHYFVW